MMTLTLVLILATCAAPGTCGIGHHSVDQTTTLRCLDYRLGGLNWNDVTLRWERLPLERWIRLDVEAEWDEWPAVVGVRCRDLYTVPLPKLANVRLAGECRGAGVYFVDLWDGSVGSDGKRLGVRVYYNLVDCRTFQRGRTYVADGRCVLRGCVYATGVRQL